MMSFERPEASAGFRRFAMALAGLSLLSACQDYLFEQKCRETVKEAEVEQPAVRPTPADILFVVDNSGSMEDEQENLAANFDAFIRNIAGGGDYRIAVVTTDLTSTGGDRRGVVTSSFKPENPPAELSGFDTTECAAAGVQHACFRGPVAGERIVTSEMTPEEQNRIFVANVRVGSCGAGKEQGLGGMAQALAQMTPGGCNEGFLRPDANLVVIIVSDEDDDSDQDIGTYLDALGRAKPAGFGQVRVAMITGSVDGTARSCRIDQGGGATSQCGSLCSSCPAGLGRAPWCDSLQYRDDFGAFCSWCSYYNVRDCCSALGGRKYIDFVLEAERRITQADPSIQRSQCRAAPGEAAACLIDSICQQSFAETLERIATELVVSTSFTLDPPAIFPEGVRVLLKGGRFPEAGTELVYGEDFSITADGRLLRLSGENTPREGEDIDIRFAVLREEASGAPRGACGI